MLCVDSHYVLLILNNLREFFLWNLNCLKVDMQLLEFNIVFSLCRISTPASASQRRTPYITLQIPIEFKKRVLSFDDCVNEIRPATTPWSQCSMGLLLHPPLQNLLWTRVNINIPILITSDPFFSPQHPHTFIIVFVHFLPPRLILALSLHLSPAPCRTPFPDLSPSNSPFLLTITFCWVVYFRILKPQISQFNLLFL